jgi:hypothetical protein
MTSAKSNPVFRLMPSLADIAFLLPVIFLFTRLEGVRTLLGDGDTGWHIRIGEWILAHGSVPKTDMFSFTRPGAPFIAWEWLWDVGAALLHDRFGLGAVVLASMLVLCLTFALLYRLVNRRCGNGLVALLLTALAAAGSAIHWLARPHLLTWLFIVIFLTLLESVREGRTRLLWLLPAITILWTNLHGGFLAGIAILGAYGSGEVLKAMLLEGAWRDRVRAARASLPYFLTGVGCAAASLVNPYFYHLHQHIVEYLRDPYEMNHIVEFQSANFRGAGAGFFEAMLALGLGAAVWFAWRRRFGDVVLVVMWAHLGLLSARNIPLYMILAAPVAGVALVAWLKTLSGAALPAWIRSSAELTRSAWDDIAAMERIGRAHVICVVVLGAVGFGMTLPRAGKFLKPEYDPEAYPSRALALLEDPAERIFTGDEWGDYLIYNLWPKGQKVYVDGRSDFYGHEFCEEYIQLVGVKYDWEQTLAKYRVNTVLLPPDAPLASTMKESSRWRIVYDDGSAIVFRLRGERPGEQVSTRSSGGKERDLPITSKQPVIFKNRGTQKGVGAI